MNHVPDSQANDRAEMLSAEDLRKTYGNRVALKSLSFSLKAGARPGLPGSEWRRQDDFDTNSDHYSPAVVRALYCRRSRLGAS